MYTNEHTKSMKPHCILGSCSAQFLSIMGWERQEEEFSGERGSNSCSVMLKNKPKRERTRRKPQEGVRLLQLVAGPKHFSPNRPVPRTQQPPSEPPADKTGRQTEQSVMMQGNQRHAVAEVQHERVELFSVLFKLHMGFHRLRSGCLLAAINMELFLLISNRITQIAYFFPY